MTKNVTFYLGSTAGLSARQLTITRMYRAGDDSAPSAQHNADAGAVDNVTVVLPDNTIWQAKLVDTRSSGEASEPQLIHFNTGELQFPGKSNQGGNSSLFAVLAMEDLSSSSSSSSQSSSSSSSSSSQSSSSSSS